MLKLVPILRITEQNTGLSSLLMLDNVRDLGFYIVTTLDALENEFGDRLDYPDVRIEKMIVDEYTLDQLQVEALLNDLDGIC